MESGLGEVQQGGELARTADRALAEILGLVEEAVGRMQQISSAADEMNRRAEQVVHAFNDMAALTEENTTATEEVGHQRDHGRPPHREARGAFKGERQRSRGSHRFGRGTLGFSHSSLPSGRGAGRNRQRPPRSSPNVPELRPPEPVSRPRSLCGNENFHTSSRRRPKGHARRGDRAIAGSISYSIGSSINGSISGLIRRSIASSIASSIGASTDLRIVVRNYTTFCNGTTCAFCAAGASAGKASFPCCSKRTRRSSSSLMRWRIW